VGDGAHGDGVRAGARGGHRRRRGTEISRRHDHDDSQFGGAGDGQLLRVGPGMSPGSAETEIDHVHAVAGGFVDGREHRRGTGDSGRPKDPVVAEMSHGSDSDYVARRGGYSTPRRRRRDKSAVAGGRKLVDGWFLDRIRRSSRERRS
jgi:hypothetical protein